MPDETKQVTAPASAPSKAVAKPEAPAALKIAPKPEVALSADESRTKLEMEAGKARLKIHAERAAVIKAAQDEAEAEAEAQSKEDKAK